MSISITLVNPTQAHESLQRVWLRIKAELMAGNKQVLTLQGFDDLKTRDQEEKYHAMLSDIAKQAMHLNQVLEADDWKRLCVHQFRTDCISNNIPRLADYWSRQKFKLIPSLDGSSLVALGAQTRRFPKYVASGFVEWLLHYGAENNIIWSVNSDD